MATKAKGLTKILDAEEISRLGLVQYGDIYVTLAGTESPCVQDKENQAIFLRELIEEYRGATHFMCNMALSKKEKRVAVAYVLYGPRKR
jgi:hypothetical protein